MVVRTYLQQLHRNHLHKKVKPIYLVAVKYRFKNLPNLETTDSALFVGRTRPTYRQIIDNFPIDKAALKLMHKIANPANNFKIQPISWDYIGVQDAEDFKKDFPEKLVAFEDKPTPIRTDPPKHTTMGQNFPKS